MNKCFILNPENILTQIRLVVFEKNAKKVHLSRKTRKTWFPKAWNCPL